MPRRKNDHGAWEIYALVDPRQPWHYRYVGKTCLTAKTRLWQHHWRASRGERSAKDNWLRGLMKLGLRAEFAVLESGSDRSWVAREQHWIKQIREDGHRLLNLTDGGEGCDGYHPTAETLAKSRGRKLTDEQKAHLSRVLKGRPIHDEATRKRMSIARKGRKLSFEHRLHLSAAKAGSRHSPETIAKMRMRVCSEQTRRKIGEISRGRVYSAETRAKLSAVRAGVPRSESTRRAISDGQRLLTSRMLRGATNPSAKLTEADVVEMRRLHEVEKEPIRSLARRFRVAVTTAKNIIRRLKWRHVP